MQLKLIVIEGQSREREIVLNLPAVIGRSRAASVTIGDPQVSRQHCHLFEAGGMVMVRDNDSINGTFVDGERVDETVIKPGAKLTVGPLTFVAVYDPAEGAQLPETSAPPDPAIGEPAISEPAISEPAVGEIDFAAMISGGEDVLPAESVEPAEPFVASAEPVLPPSADMVSTVTNEAVEAKSTNAATADPSSDSEPVPRPIQAAGVPIAQPAETAPPESGDEFNWLAGEAAEGDEASDPPDIQTESPVGANPAGSGHNEEVVKEAEPAAAVEDVEQLEAPPAATPAKAEKKKRSWWPFGKKKPTSESADAEDPAPAVVDANNVDAKPKQANPNEAIQSGPDAQSDGAFQRTGEADQDDGPFDDAYEDEDDAELGDFLSGLP